MWVQRTVSAKMSTNTGIELGVVLVVCVWGGGEGVGENTCVGSVKIRNSCEADALKFFLFVQ